MGTSGNRDCQWAFRSVLKDFTEDTLTISAGSLVKNGPLEWWRRIGHGAYNISVGGSLSFLWTMLPQCSEPGFILCYDVVIISSESRSDVILWRHSTFFTLFTFSDSLDLMLWGHCFWTTLQVSPREPAGWLKTDLTASLIKRILIKLEPTYLLVGKVDISWNRVC